MSRRCFFAALILLGCADHEPIQPLRNQCAQGFGDCTAPYRCDTELGMCIRPQALRPFHVALQVFPSAGGADGLVKQWTIDPGIPADGGIPIPRAVVVSGEVRGEHRDRTDDTIEAELAFVPDPSTAKTYLTRVESTFTQRVEDNGRRADRFSWSLEPNKMYQVQVFPLGDDSIWFPPAIFSLQTDSADLTNYRFSYQIPEDELETFSATMADENGNKVPNGLKVRLQEKGTGRVVSSLGTTGKRLIASGDPPTTSQMDEPGAFSVRARKAVLNDLSKYELVLGLETKRNPWLVSIAFDGARLRRDARVTMPLLPNPVQFVGTIGVGDTGGAPNDINAEVTFLSTFPIPEDTGKRDVRERDWCRLRQLGSPQGTFRCSARVTTSVGTDLQVVASLLPGDYQVFLIPSTDSVERRRSLVTNASTASINSQDDGSVQAGQTFDVSGTAAVYRGRVRSPRNDLMPLVKVTAKALSVVYDLDETARYSRSAEDTSNKDGQFELAIDTGYYDLIAEPPEGSGFASRLQYNRRIADASVNSIRVEPSYPVPARGTLVTQDGRPVANARVEAYAIVPNLEPAGERAVLIARTTSNDAGAFTLLLPPCIGTPDDCNETNAGVNIDASVQLVAGAVDAGVPPPTADGGVED